MGRNYYEVMWFFKQSARAKWRSVYARNYYVGEAEIKIGMQMMQSGELVQSVIHEVSWLSGGMRVVLVQGTEAAA